jgi:hypothetical protein
MSDRTYDRLKELFDQVEKSRWDKSSPKDRRSFDASSASRGGGLAVMRGFLIAADAIVPCKACGVPEGVPCMGLKNGQVHFGRRVRRLLLTAGAPEKRDEFEARAVAMLRKHL